MGNASLPPPGFVALVEKHLGLDGDGSTTRTWAAVLKQRLGATRSLDFESYSRHVESAETRKEEVAQLAQVMTVGETYFFRDSRQFEALTTVILPELLHRRAPDAKIQVLSVACSTGEEPYSVAIAAQELLWPYSDRIQIRAFDINPKAIASAENGVYTDWALRATPTAIRNRYFTSKGNQHVLVPAIRSLVQFEVRNLFDEDPAYWRVGRVDVILCRNAFIYFSRRKIAEALRRFADVLADDGTLFLGNAETPRGFEQRFAARELGGCFVYSVANQPMMRALPVAAQPATSLTTEHSSAGQEVSNSDGSGWVLAIEAATQRLAYLALRAHSVEPITNQSTRRVDCGSLLEKARQLLTLERFGEALEILNEIVSAGHTSPEVHLLRASILTNQGRFLESTDVCHRLLVDEPHCSGAYHLLGVACEHAGKLDAAQRHHQTAITLDPNFAMSHWLLGRLCLRTGQQDSARRYLSRALELWHAEDPTAALAPDLFAGGFGREPLVRLCRSDLARCEVRR